MADIWFHKYNYPHKPTCTICMEEQEHMIHIERTYSTHDAHVADSLYVCYKCIDDMELCVMRDK